MFMKGTVTLSAERYKNLSVVLNIGTILTGFVSDCFVCMMQDCFDCLLNVFLSNMTYNCDVDAVVLADIVWCWGP